MAKKTVLFVCTGNTCRSPLAKVLAKAAFKAAGLDGWQVDSAGLAATPGAPASMLARDCACEIGLDLSDHCARPVSVAMLTEAKWVLTMTESHKNALISAAPVYAHKIQTLKSFVGAAGDVTDPYGGSIEQYRQTVEELRELIKRLPEMIKD